MPLSPPLEYKLQEGRHRNWFCSSFYSQPELPSSESGRAPYMLLNQDTSPSRSPGRLTSGFTHIVFPVDDKALQDLASVQKPLLTHFLLEPSISDESTSSVGFPTSGMIHILALTPVPRIPFPLCPPCESCSSSGPRLQSLCTLSNEWISE